MNSKPKRPRALSQYNRQLVQIIDKYSEETGYKTVDLSAVAVWARAKGLLDLPPVDVNKILAKALARASREEYIEDENGEPVRRRHAYKVSGGDKQQRFWFKMEDGTPEQMKMSGQQRRKGVVDDVQQVVRDLTFYNKHYNPGEPIEFDWNINLDLADRAESSEYSDTPPPDDGE